MSMTLKVILYFMNYKDKDGNLHKVRKADADRTISTEEHAPMMYSQRKAQKEYPGARTTQIPNSKQKITGVAKEAEAKTVREQRVKGNTLPPNKEKDKRYHNNKEQWKLA